MILTPLKSWRELARVNVLLGTATASEATGAIPNADAIVQTAPSACEDLDERWKEAFFDRLSNPVSNGGAESDEEKDDAVEVTWEAGSEKSEAPRRVTLKEAAEQLGDLVVALTGHNLIGAANRLARVASEVKEAYIDRQTGAAVQRVLTDFFK